MKTIGILLAAGASQRMGRPKQLIQIGQKPLVIHSLDTLLEAHLAKVILVLGYSNEEILKLAPTSKKLVTVINNNYANGMSSSIKTGMAHLPPNTDAVMISLADQPFITTSIINKLIDCASVTTKNIVAPSWQEKRGHPVIFKKKYFQELLQLSRDEGGRSILNMHHHDILPVNVTSTEILVDINTPKDLHIAIQKYKQI